MRRLSLTEDQLRVVMAALEDFISEEQISANEQGLEATADQEIAEAILDAIEEGTPPSLG